MIVSTTIKRILWQGETRTLERAQHKHARLPLDVESGPVYLIIFHLVELFKENSRDVRQVANQVRFELNYALGGSNRIYPEFRERHADFQS